MTPMTTNSDGPASDGSTAAGMEHLQGAAREMVAAARSFLDAVDGVIEDNDRFASVAGGVADVLSRLGSMLTADAASPVSPDDDAAPSRVRRIVVE